jgi:hypothetical protein
VSAGMVALLGWWDRAACGWVPLGMRGIRRTSPIKENARGTRKSAAWRRVRSPPMRTGEPAVCGPLETHGHRWRRAPFAPSLLHWRRQADAKHCRVELMETLPFDVPYSVHTSAVREWASNDSKRQWGPPTRFASSTTARRCSNYLEILPQGNDVRGIQTGIGAAIAAVPGATNIAARARRHTGRRAA